MSKLLTDVGSVKEMLKLLYMFLFLVRKYIPCGVNLVYTFTERPLKESDLICLILYLANFHCRFITKSLIL